MEITKNIKDQVQNLFNNPFSTPIGSKLDKATSSVVTTSAAANSSINWPLFLEICDDLNNPSHEETSIRDFMRAIKKKLNTKENNQDVLLTLDLLEVVVKNCPSEKLRKDVFDKTFLNELLRAVGNQSTQEKTLSLIQQWTFSFEKRYPQLQDFYEELKEKGIDFPGIDVDQNSPVCFEDEPVLHPITIPLTSQQHEKLMKEINIVQGNVAVFNEILSEKQQFEDDVEFLKGLNQTCKEMQYRITNLLTEINDDAMVNELLAVNDELNSVFLRYGRYLKNQEKLENVETQRREANSNMMATAPSAAATTAAATGPSVKSGAVPKTIPMPLTPQKSSKMPSSSSSQQPPQTHTESDFKEMEEWLKDLPPQPPLRPTTATGTRSPLLQQPQQPQQLLSSDDFDKFLQERAALKK